MTERTYTQQEVDALIAGAYLAQRQLIEKWRGIHFSDSKSCICEDACADELEQAMAPDAACLALEERDKEKLEHENLCHLNLMEHVRELVDEIEMHCPCGARPESLSTHPHTGGCPVFELKRAISDELGTGPAQAGGDVNKPLSPIPDIEREAKLIADTLRAASEHFLEFWKALCELEPSVNLFEKPSGFRLAQEIRELAPDAARLALEELRQERDVAREANAIGPCGKHPLSCYTADEKITSVGRGVITKGYCTVCAEFAEREAAIRDKALDEAAAAIEKVQHVTGNVQVILALKGTGK